MDKNILSKVFSAKSVAIFIHINPDADAVGAAIAMKLALEKNGIVADCFSENDIIEHLLSIKGASMFNTAEEREYDLGLILDCAESSRIGINMSKILKKCKQTAIIDHHEKVDALDIDYIYSDNKAASCTQIIYYLFKDYDKNIIDKDIAEALYAGVLTDSGGFLFNNVSNNTMQMVAELYEYNINASNLARALMCDVKKCVFDLQTLALSNARFFDNNTIGIVVLTKEMFKKTNTTEQDTSNMVNKIVDIKEVKLAISIAEVSYNAYKVSARSKNSDYALSLARCFGGGGHKEAAGCRVYGYLEDCIEKLLGAARDVLADD